MEGIDGSSGASNIKRFVSKTLSHHDSQGQHEGLKRKTSDDVAESLNLELGNLKKTKLLNGDIRKSMVPSLSGKMCLESKGNGVDDSIRPEIENVSLMSINFSQYELMRNLSHSNFRSDGGSQSTCSTLSLVDRELKNEHLERYFKSVDIWNKQFEATTSETKKPM